MARILGVHGIWNIGYYVRHGSSERAAADAVSVAWCRALGRALRTGPEVRVCYYSHHLHQGTEQAGDDPAMLPPGAQDVLVEWAHVLRGEGARAQGARTVQARAAADWICGRFPGAARRAVLAFCREIHTYQYNAGRRAGVTETLRAAIREHRPEVLVAHSLGSVVAYETLWGDPGLKLGCLVTLGSPLGMPGVVFERLDPAPVGDNGSRPRGARPPGVGRWVNIADVGDIVAVPLRLRGLFAGIDEEIELTLGDWPFHAVKDYLRSRQVRTVLRPYLEPGDAERT